MAAEDDFGTPAFHMAEDDSQSQADSPFEDELPPIGFFFDDSDDAAPAEVQSGTFADAAPLEPEPEPEPELAPETAEDPSPPEPEAPAAPVDPLPALVLDDRPPLPGVTHGLRALFPGALSPAQRAGFRDCANRLSALAIAAE